MNALVVGASPVVGADDWYGDLLPTFDLLVACDAAGEWCAALGRTPDLALGDFDSAESGAPERLRALGANVVEYPAHKDESDLELALAAALKRGATSITVTAAFTNRLDHTLAAVGLAIRMPTGTPLAFRDPGLDAHVLRAAHQTIVVIETVPGALVSVVALTQADGVTLSGLAYPLLNASLAALSSLGVSNVATSSRVTVRASRGTLLVMSVDESRNSVQVLPRPCR